MESYQLSGAARAFEVFCRAKGPAPRTVKTHGDGLETAHRLPDGSSGPRSNAPNTGPVAIHVRSLNAFFSYLSQDGFLGNNPMDGIPIPKTRRSAPVASGQPEVRALLAAARSPSWFDARNSAMIMTFLDTGMRLAELISLDLEDVNLPDWRIRIRNGKGLKREDCVCGPWFHRVLHRWLAIHGALHQTSALFVTRSGCRHDSRNVERILERIAADRESKHA